MGTRFGKKSPSIFNDLNQYVKTLAMHSLVSILVKLIAKVI